MNDLKNCKICGKIFQSRGYSDICNNCTERDELNFKRIREYLYQNPCANMFEVATRLDVSISKIKHYLRESRLEILERDNSFLCCEKCGQPIQSGKFCTACYSKMNKGLKVIYTESLPSGSGQRVNYLPYGNSKKGKVASL